MHESFPPKTGIIPNRDQRRTSNQCSLESVLRRMLHAVDNDEFDIPSSGLQLQAELVLQGSKDPTCRVDAWPGGIWWRVKLWKSKIEVETTDQTCPVDDGPVGEHRQHAREHGD